MSPSSAPSLQSLCIFSLANTEAGQAVINIMGIGVDTIDMVMASQPSRWVLSFISIVWGKKQQIFDNIWDVALTGLYLIGDQHSDYPWESVLYVQEEQALFVTDPYLVFTTRSPFRVVIE